MYIVCLTLPQENEDQLVPCLSFQPSIGMHLPELVQPVLTCFEDQDARVRYYACESLYNISKVARGAVLVFFNNIFEGLCKVRGRKGGRDGKEREKGEEGRGRRREEGGGRRKEGRREEGRRKEGRREGGNRKEGRSAERGGSHDMFVPH